MDLAVRLLVAEDTLRTHRRVIVLLLFLEGDCVRLSLFELISS